MAAAAFPWDRNLEEVSQITFWHMIRHWAEPVTGGHVVPAMGRS